MSSSALTTTAGSSLIFNNSDPNTPLISLNLSGVTKLTTTNYLTWKLQARALLEGHELHVFLEDGTAPEPTVVTGNTSAQNPLFVHWKRQDRLLYGALLGTLSLPVQSLVTRTTTSLELWKSLSNTFGKASRSHVKTLQNQLTYTTKGTQTVDEYMRNIIAKADQLALMGAPVLHEDLLDKITAGLGDEYRVITEMVNGRDTPIGIEELHEKLRNHENNLLLQESLSQRSLPVTANAAHYYRQAPMRGNYRGSSPSRGNYRGGRSYQDNNRAGRGYQGKCQLCGVFGHSAKRCAQLGSSPLIHQYATPPATPQYRGLLPSPTPQPQWQPQAHYTAATPADSAPWLLDSGASHHIASDLSTLSLHSPYGGNEEVMIGDGNGLGITHTGSANLSSGSRPLHLTNVLCVPTMKKNLISVNKQCKTNNVMVQLCPYSFQVRDLNTGAPILKGKAKEGVYEWPTTSSISAYATTIKSSSEWHARLGHPSSQILNFILTKFSLPTLSMSSSLLCNSCSSNKSHKLSFSTSTILSRGPLDVVYSDVWTSPIYSIDGFKYYVVFVDHFTRYVWLYPLKQKSQVAQIFPRFKALVENKFKTRITTFYSDNGGEYIGLASFLSMHGITHLTTPPHTPEHNGLAERRHRHIVETGLALLTHAGIPQTYWSYSFAVAVYLINRMPTETLNKASPFQLLFQADPNYNKLRTFGCLCYPWLRPYGQTKFSPKSTPCIFLGYSLTQSAYICLDISTSRLYISRHVVFHESVFPFSQLSQTSIPSPLDFTTVPVASVAPTYRQPLTTPSAPPLDLSPADLEPASSIHSTVSATEPESAQNEEEHVPSPVPAEPSLNTHSMTTRSKNNIQKPNPKYGLTVQLKEIEPATHTEALKDEKWRRSMSAELDSQIREHTWDLVPPNASQNVVGNRWVFRIKRRADGSIEKYKSRLVAKGFHQKPGVDYFETFSPVIKHATIRLVLGIATARDWPLRQLDVNNAFLQGQLMDEVYMKQPVGFEDRDFPNYVCRLRKAIYGLKQAPRAWYNELRSFLLQLGFTNSLGDASLFVLNKDSVLTYILVYVDDIVVTGSNAEVVERTIKTLSDRFSLKDHGELSYFLGMEATRTKAGLSLTQTKYITDLLVRHKMADAKPVSTPMASTCSLTASHGVKLPDSTTYRTLVGSLQYLSLTRPDISFAVNRLSQFMHEPTTIHEDAAKRVLRYLAGTVTKGIFFSASTPLNLHAYTDADWAGDKDGYSSTGAYIVYLGKQPISWSSRKLKGVARSSTEAEYRALAEAASEVKWISSLLTELGIKSSTTPTVFCDNIGATYLSANPVFHSRMKHLALDYHFVREQVHNGTLRVSHICSADQLADALTKPLPRARFTDLTVKIGLRGRSPS